MNKVRNRWGTVKIGGVWVTYPGCLAGKMRVNVRVRVYVCNDYSIAFSATARLDSLHFPVLNPMPLPAILRDTRYFFAWDHADKRACQTR